MNMCTRFFISDDSLELKSIVEEVKKAPLTERYVNTAGRRLITRGEVRPTDLAPVLAPSPDKSLAVYPMKWGFTNKKHHSTLFNARVETAGSKSMFRESWKSHRCIVPASYYFEWEHFKNAEGKTKTGDKYAIQPRGATSTWLCGLYRIENGFPVFVVLTREPGESVKKIHDRMPLILPHEKIGEWIEPSTEPESLLPYALTDMVAERV